VGEVVRLADSAALAREFAVPALAQSRDSIAPALYANFERNEEPPA
jgi:hypothetical protein